MMASSQTNDFQKHLADGETTVARLKETLRTAYTDKKPLPGFDPNKDDVEHYRPQRCQHCIDYDEGFDPNKYDAEYYRAHHCIDCDEVYPGIYIGDADAAKDKDYLKILGITHVLNCAEGIRFGFVNTFRIYYKDTTIKYLGLPVSDLYTTDISRYFNMAVDFIDEAVSTGGKAFVHGVQGMSRCGTCVLAYLMIKKEMLAVDAIRIVRKKHFIQPNDGFIRQLAQLDNQLRRQRL